MKFNLAAFVFIACAFLNSNASEPRPLRAAVCGEASFDPSLSKILSGRDVVVDSRGGFPNAAELERYDILVLRSRAGSPVQPEQRSNLMKFLSRGGGLVVLHEAAVSDSSEWFQILIGGGWQQGSAKWNEGEAGLYFSESDHPITRGISNFDLRDAVGLKVRTRSEARVLASAFESVFEIDPQIWTFERDNSRVFVCLPGRAPEMWGLPQMQVLLRRAVAWAGRRELPASTSDELLLLKYPPGGPLAPEKAAATIRTRPEFEVTLAAAEPLVEKPISIDWDERGRMWVAETPEYPLGRRVNRTEEMVPLWRDSDPQTYTGKFVNRPARDRIVILTDTNGDGRMDSRSIFSEGLELVTGFVFYRDGVIVAQAPDILWLRDTNNDGEADKRQVVFTGFGTFDTHAVISNLRWGMDGWIYASQGYSGANVTSPDGAKKFGKFGAGVLRFRPDGSAIEMVASKGGNMWGMDFAWDGELFFTQANGTHLQHVVMPEAVLARGRVGSTPSFQVLEDHKRVFPIRETKRQAYVQIDNVGGFTAGSGCLIYEGGAWPAPFAGAHFISETTVNLVHMDLLKREGISFAATKDREEEFLASTDLWFRPVDQRYGPDGALYVLDFYNQTAVHNDTRGPKHGPGNVAIRPDRDHHFGRIWRIQHREARQLDQPRLSRHNPAELVRALEHTNRFYRLTAQRLLEESNLGRSGVERLEEMLESGRDPRGRVHALWTLQNRGQLSRPTLLAALADSDAAVRKNALRVVSETPRHAAGVAEFKKALLEGLKSPDERVQIEALAAVGSQPIDAEVAAAVVSAYPNFNDAWRRSAALGIAARAPRPFVTVLLATNGSSPSGTFAREIGALVGDKQDAELAEYVAGLVAAKSGAAEEAREALLRGLAERLRAEVVPPWTAGLETALRVLIESDSRRVASAALPLVARWDKQGSLKAAAQKELGLLRSAAADASKDEEARSKAVEALLSARSMDEAIVADVAELLKTEASESFKLRIIGALGRINDAVAGKPLAKAYSVVGPALREAVFVVLIQRADWTREFLGELRDRRVAVATLNPLAIHRLRTHSDRGVASEAARLIEKLRGPELKEKDAIIAKLQAAISGTADLKNGQVVFQQNCATCHKFKGDGSDLAPDLTGMGAHGTAELLTHIVDPNRLVEPNFVSQSVETRDGQTLDGIVARENSSSLVLRNAQGEVEIRKAEIKEQRSTGLSLMPNGFEALGETNLRDLLGFLSAGEEKFRVLDMTAAFTADSTKGIYASDELWYESLRFTKFGLVKAGEVPFEIVHPLRSANGRNVTVLKGGRGFAKTLPERAEFKVGLAASKLHFLGGVGGWAWPCCGEERNENLPVAKVTVHFTGGRSEEIVLRNGQEIADYNGKFDVPRSEAVEGLVSHGQIRRFTKPLSRKGVIEKVVLESFDNSVAPTFVAITAEMD